jgi:nucleotide-binding universal stress UspA family protein
MKILLAVDGSPCSDVAIAQVAHLPLPAETIVHIVAVETPIEATLLPRVPTTAFNEIVRQQRAEVARRLDDAVDTLQRLAPGLTVLPKLLEGHPKDTIVNEAQRWGADLIVIGSHGYGPVRRFFLGSVSQFVAHHASCAVLIARCKPESRPEPDTPATA